MNGFTPAEFGTKLDSVKNRELGASELLQLLDDSIPSIQEKTAGAPVRAMPSKGQNVSRAKEPERIEED